MQRSFHRRGAKSAELSQRFFSVLSQRSLRLGGENALCQHCLAETGSSVSATANPIATAPGTVPGTVATGSAFRQTKRKLAVILLAILLLVLLSPGECLAVVPFSEYLSQVSQSSKIVSELRERLDDEELTGEDARAEITQTLSRLREMLPATEDVEFNGEIIHVDNSWLPVVAENKEQKLEALKESLDLVSARLTALDQRLQAAVNPPVEIAPEKERLQNILAQTEYQQELHKESAIERWLRKLQEKLVEVLARLFGARPDAPSPPSTTTLNLFRAFLLCAVGLIVVIGLVRLFRRLNEGKGEDEDTEAREVLGELIEAGTTGEDLFRNAAELARQGNYRMAVRRAYIALLYELEQRDKLRLHRAKTNHDYLNELRGELYLYPTIEKLTAEFERSWYGEVETNLADYSSFVEKYREVISVR